MTTPNDRAFLDALEAMGTKPKVLSSLDAEATEVLEGTSKDHPTHTSSVPAPPANVTRENFWRHPDAHPIALDLAMLRQYGPEWMGWEAETLRVLIPQDFKTQAVSELTIAKLQACKVLHLVDAFWERWEVFLACLQPFNNEFPDFRTMAVPTVAQCLVACDVAARIRDDVAWSAEMQTYVATIYAHDGIFLPLPPADFVTITVPEEVDVAALAARWPAARAAKKGPSGDTMLDEQLRRLVGANDFLELSRTHLQHQLGLHV